MKENKKIGVMGAAFLGIGSMVGAGIFALLGEAGTVAGTAVWLSFLIAGIIALLQGYSFAKLGTVFSSQGGVVEFLIQGFKNGHTTGVVSWLLYFASLIVCAMVAVSFGSYANALFFGENASPEAAKLLSLVILVILAALNLESGASVAKIQKVIVWLVIMLLGGFAFITIRNGDFSMIAPETYPPLKNIISSVALTFFAFLGFSVVAFTAGDMDNPKKNMPRAMYLSLIITTIIYVAIALGVFGMLTLDEVIASGNTAIAEAAKPILGMAGFTIMTITAVLSTSSAVNSGYYGLTNLSKYLAKIGQFPPIFAKKVGTTGSVGTIISAIIVAFFVFFLDLSAIASIGSVVALITFIMIGIAHLKLIKKTGANIILVLLSIITVLVTLVIFTTTTLIYEKTTLIFLCGLLISAVVIDRFWREVPLLKKWS